MRISSLSLFAVIAAALVGCTAENSEAPAEAHSESDLLSQRRQLEARVQRLSDLQELRGIIDCYGMGHDLLFKDLGGAHREALDVLRRCHVDGLVTNVFLFDESKPAQRLESLTAFVGFVDSFAQQNGYTSARNVPGNVRIEFMDPATAKILSSTEAPHFLTKGPPAASDRPTLDLVEARDVDTAKRDRDGTCPETVREIHAHG